MTNEDILRAEVEALRKRNATQAEYITLLCEEINKYAVFLYTHGITSDPKVVERAVALRKELGLDEPEDANKSRDSQKEVPNRNTCPDKA